MGDRWFHVSDPQPTDSAPLRMSETELRQTYGFLVDVIDLEAFRQVVVVYGGVRIEVNEVFDTPSEHFLPQ